MISRDFMFNPKVGSKALEMVSVRDTFFHMEYGMMSSIVLILLLLKKDID